MSQRVEPLEPKEPGHVRLYVCGLTTYDHAHAGHARTFIVFDVLVRFLRVRGFRVTFVRNVTDVDDKILARAKESGEAPLELSRRMSEINDEELRACGCAPPDREPRVSESIGIIVSLIEDLLAKGAAYVAPTSAGRDVYFSVPSYPPYGKLSRRVLEDQVAGARVEPGEGKRDPADFALWKASPEGVLGWDSPWGKGRPGWHIECSAMAAHELSPHIDVHGGGMDLIFPHHENEIAQCEAAWGEPFSRLWMHTGFLKVDAEKMGKSLGNFVKIAQILERNDGEALRYFVLGAHYRGPLNFDLDRKESGRVVFPGLDEAERRVEYLYAAREALTVAAAGASEETPWPEGAQAACIREAPERVLAALDNDLNTSVALSIIGEVARVGNEVALAVPKLKKDARAQGAMKQLARGALRALDACCRPLGLMLASGEEFAARTRERRLTIRGLSAAEIEARVSERTGARAAKDFARSDAIRAELAAMGVELQDAVGGGGTTWRVMV
jgi:cysteinyl-tRNA synthetase